MKIEKNKTGAIFLIAMLALAGVGISYAGWTDTIHVSGSADTGSVSWEVIEYSGTWVYKIAPHGKDVIYDSYTPDQAPYEPTTPADAIAGYDDHDWVAASWAQPSTDPDYDVEVFYENLYPCTVFEADMTIEYTGSIPGRLNELILTKDEGWNDYFDQYATVEVFDASGALIPLVDLPGYQLHDGDTLHIVLSIHLPQQNNLMLKSGSFGLEVIVVQWNEYPYDYSGECGGDVDLAITKEVDDSNPYVGDEIVYTLTAINNGPDEAEDVQVIDDEPEDLSFTAVTATKGSIQIIGDQVVWDIGNMAFGETQTATITATVDSYGTFAANTQLCMILDGSGSIGSGEWDVMLEGIATALRDETIFPHDGTVELTVIQFAGNTPNNAEVELSPVIITDANYDSTATAIENIGQDGGNTPMYAGIDLAKTTIEGSSNHPDNDGDFTRQVFNLVTDGQPNVGTGGSNGEDSAENSRDALVATLNDGEDEFDAEGVGSGPDIEWLRTEIVWPEDPITGDGYEAPPFDKGPGWVRHVTDFDEFADTIGEKFQLILQSIVNCAEIVSRENDLYPDDNIDCVTIYPQPCVDPDFTELGLLYKFTGTWDPVTGDLETGYTQNLNTQYDYCYLDVDDGQVTTNIQLAEEMYPFYLDTSSVPADYYDYWDAKGVNAAASGGWQEVMYDIITGVLPMFYYRYDTSETDMHYLVDGLQYQNGQGELPLRISTDYPVGTYTFFGDIESICGSTSEVEIQITFTTST